MVKSHLIRPAVTAALLLASAPLPMADESGTMTETAEDAMAERIALGRDLYADNCAACHGERLEGQPNWQVQGDDGIWPAPPHDENGHTWHHSDRQLFEYTKLGGKEAMARIGMDVQSGMPGFGELLSDDEIRMVLDYIRSNWPERERQIQEARTAADKAQRGE